MAIDNTEIIYKILKAAAKQYGCSVIYDAESSTIKFIGPDEMKKAISEEVLSFFKPQQ